MKKFLSLYVAVTVLAFQFLNAADSEVSAPAERPVLRIPESTPPAAQSDQQSWQTELQSTRATRNALFVLGLAAIVGGLVLYSKGVSKDQSARDVPGCDQSGDKVVCTDPAAANEAQHRIDSGKEKIVLGTVSASAGILF